MLLVRLKNKEHLLVKKKLILGELKDNVILTRKTSGSLVKQYVNISN